jgi:Fe-S-cluster containining protein
MTILETAPASIQAMLQPFPNDGLRFACHAGVSCFTECCRDLNLLLTPYDIARLKNRLSLTAGEFLDRYTEVCFDEGRNLAMVYLQMQDNELRTCPFVSAAGCEIYADRPSACRIYPLARASRMNRRHGNVEEDYFVLRERHCRGFEEHRVWAADEWIVDQGLYVYHELNNLWMAVVTHAEMRKNELSERQQQMFFLASYDMDRFRAFILESGFLQAFDLPVQEVEALGRDDEVLLRLAIKWLNFSLCNEPTLTLREQQ